jgi:hypothetical protein
MKSIPVIKSYVWHGKKCFFVSTVERDSSCDEPSRYNETTVWDYDYDARTRGELLFCDGAGRGSTRQHYAVCERIVKTGSPAEEDEP